MKPLALMVLLTLGAASPAAATNLGSMEASWPAGSAHRVRVEFPTGQLVVVATDQPTIRAILTVRCEYGGRSCIERSRKIRMLSDQNGGTRLLKVEGIPKLNNHGLKVELRVEVPRALAVDLDAGAGDVTVDGVEGDVVIALGVGDVELSMHERDVHSMHLNVGIGDASVDRHGHREEVSGFLSKTVRWSDGPGHSRVSVELGIGDISVQLD
jgi:hypothetical protein